MPEPPLDTRQESMKYHVDGSSLEGASILFTANGGAPARPGGSPLHYASDSDDSGKAVASDSDDSGKAVVVESDTEASGGTGKELTNAASSSSSSSSSSPVAVTEDMCNNLGSDSSSQHDEAEAEVTTALPISMRGLAITPMNESDAHYYWRNQAPRLFEDTPEQANISSGLGIHETVRLMSLTEEPQHDADPLGVQEPEDLLMAPSTSITTFQVPGFSMGLAGGTVPFADEQFVEVPDDVGLEDLDIFVNP